SFSVFLSIYTNEYKVLFQKGVKIMNNITKTLLYIFIILFVISLYKDLTIGTQLHSTDNQQSDKYEKEIKDINAMRVKVKQGDTVLSIVEQLNNKTINTMDIKQILADFKALNPTVASPKSLKPN